MTNDLWERSTGAVVAPSGAGSASVDFFPVVDEGALARGGEGFGIKGDGGLIVKGEFKFHAVAGDF